MRTAAPIRETHQPWSPVDMEAAGMVVGGDSETGRDLEIDGDVEGDLAGRRITVLEGASVEGNLGGQTVVVHGAVRGVIQAATIQVRSTAMVEGELHYKTLAVDPGARVEARCAPSH